MPDDSRTYSFSDQFCMGFDRALKALFGKGSDTAQEGSLKKNERKHIASLIRVDHAGEVCAQALYQGHALISKNAQVRDMMLQAGEEEKIHLQWCATRLSELHSHPSFLNPLWFAGSFAMGILAGLAGDRLGLGFMAETERQVAKHLADHLQRLPPQDVKSKQMLQQMLDDEKRHATHAIDSGGIELPDPVKTTMRWTAKIMTTTAYWI